MMAIKIGGTTLHTQEQTADGGGFCVWCWPLAKLGQWIMKNTSWLCQCTLGLNWKLIGEDTATNIYLTQKRRQKSVPDMTLPFCFHMSTYLPRFWTLQVRTAVLPISLRITWPGVTISGKLSTTSPLLLTRLFLTSPDPGVSPLWWRVLAGMQNMNYGLWNTFKREWVIVKHV